MNVHYLELFHYVAKHGGISAAARHIPYGILQPAVSTQIGRLEADLGVRLFERQPFRLTPAGVILQAYVAPFFDTMPEITQRIRGAREAELRVGAAELILRDHLPDFLREARKEFAGLQLRLHTVSGQLAEQRLSEEKLDLAFLPLTRRPPPGLKQRPLVRLPLSLEVHARLGIRSVRELFSARTITVPLIALSSDSPITQLFQAELKRRGIRWRETIEVTTLDLVRRYAAAGDGVGLTVDLGANGLPRGLRVLKLDGFAPVRVGALWRGQLSAPAKLVVELVHAHAKAKWPDAVL